LRCEGFGGRQRSIHTDIVEELRGTSNWEVISKRNVKTGTWTLGYAGSDGDCDPPFLGDEKTHVLLSLRCTGSSGPLEHEYEWTIYDRIEIEACNVTRK